MAQESLSREYKVALIKAVYDKTRFDEMILKANTYQLSDIQEFLWDAALYVGRDEEGKALTREAITLRMLPTAEYWRSQLCGEPLDTCRGRSCFVSHPVCAGNKLKGQIEVIRQFFERRKQRGHQAEEGLLMLMMFHINENHYAAAGLYSADRLPLSTVGSRVLTGDALRNVIQAMNVVIGQHFHDEGVTRPIIIGEGKLIVHGRKIHGGDGDAILAVTAPEEESNDNLDKVFKKVEMGMRRINKNKARIENVN